MTRFYLFFNRAAQFLQFRLNNMMLSWCCCWHIRNPW